MGILIVVVPPTVPAVENVDFTVNQTQRAGAAKSQKVGTGIQRSIKYIPDTLMLAVFTVIVKVPWLAPLPGPALKQAASPATHAMREPLLV